MKTNIKTALAATVGLIATGFVAGNYSPEVATRITIGLGSAAAAGGGAWFVIDAKNRRLRHELEATSASLKSNKVEHESLELERTRALNTAQLMLSDTKRSLEKKTKELVKLRLVTEEDAQKIAAFTKQVADLEQALKVTTAQRDEFRNESTFKEQQLSAFETTFQAELKTEVEKRYQQTVRQEVEQETTTAISLVDASTQILLEIDTFMQEVYSRHQAQNHYALDMNNQFAEMSRNRNEKKQQVLDTLLSENEILEHRLLTLEKTLADGFIHPVYGDYGLTSDEGKNINGLVEWCFRHLQVTLKALGFDTTDDVVSFGLDYPKTQAPQHICDSINQHKDELTKYLGIHSFTRIEYLSKYDVIAIGYRQTAPKPPSDEDIYKRGLIPAAQFCDAVYKATDHNSKGKPTLRIMAATGEGKGIVTKNLVGYFAELDNWELWVSDPLHGSEQDYWDCPKIAKDAKESKQAYKLFNQLHRTRIDDKVDGFTSRFVLGVFDEFDKQHSDTDKETAKAIMTAIRHTKQRQILIGQCAEVGSNGWTWDDMKNCAMLVLGNSIGTLCKHLVKDLGWTTKRTNQVKTEYEVFSKWAREKNEANPDIPNENSYRIGLLVVGDDYRFLELPNAHKGIIRSGKAVLRDSLSINTQKEALPNNNTADLETIEKPVLQVEIKCPSCQSTQFKRNGKTSTKVKVQKYLCKDCGKGYDHNDLLTNRN
jgi:predicted RNA-binding Zn-ribbon protein involved in translation (DUF1610 family)